ncbi:class I SAM-dependent methyltransferase [Patulibacter sp. NPDC049589]|uniref:class I SAM-dependent methyltransferase n=1 Tax=Patulibacter sp. NPDC049589 TaxID=3154731 RepID=UPI00341EA976
MPLVLPATLDRLHERLFVAGYASVQARSEAAGMRDVRRAVVAPARGRVLEIGAGTGLNLAHYGPGVTSLVLVEPAPAMRDVLADAVARGPGREGWSVPGVAAQASVVDGHGERLPAADGSVDVVVGTFVLCSVEDPEAVLREIARVLHPGGRYLGIEHVRGSTPGLARAQGAVAPAWRFLARGCRCDQDAAALIARSSLLLEESETFRGPRQPWPVRPGLRFAARRP